MKNLIYILVSFILFSCNGKSKIQKENLKKKKNLELGITITYPKSNLRKIPKTWESLDDIQKEWIMVMKDKDGYFIYDPCDGSTETIKFENSNILLINRRVEGEKFSYEKITKFTENSSFRLTAFNIDSKKDIEINARIVDHENGIVLWEFEGIKWVMTPKENYNSFRIIKNNCKIEKKPELYFSPIEDYK